MEDSKDVDKEVHALHLRGPSLSMGDSSKAIEEKQIEGKGGEIILPAYDAGAEERRGSVNLSGVQDKTHRKLKARHIQLIGIGGTIGTALYVQIGRGLLNGGPASLFLAFTIWCSFILAVTM